jgi:hypothetical protein
MRGPRMRACAVSPPPGFATDSTGVLPLLAGSDSGVVTSPLGDVETGGRLRTGRFLGRTPSPSTWWQNTATAVLLVGRQCWVRRSAMERYDARFWRNSVMTSFAGSKSWNFCGRSGVNSATAWRTVAGSNEVIGGSDADVNRENDRWQNRHGDATTRTIRCRSTLADRLRS